MLFDNVSALESTARRIGLGSNVHETPNGLLCLQNYRWRPSVAEFSLLNVMLLQVLLHDIGVFFGILTSWSSIRSLSATWTYWSMAPCVRITDNVGQWPAKAYLSNHHREGTRHLDVLAQFLPYERHAVVTELSSNPFFELCRQYIYGETNLKGIKTSADKHWTLYRLIESNDAVNVFPDREGSQYFGDHVLVFRPGLFAASMATGVPIIDIVLVEPTPAHNYLDIVFSLWNPPAPAAGVLKSAQEYATWRTEHNDAIEAFTKQCNDSFLATLGATEAAKASCGLSHTDVCTRERESKIQKCVGLNMQLLYKSRSVFAQT